MTVDYATLNRRDLTFVACDAIARTGKKPAISSVRAWTLQHAGLQRGSDGDVQSDINAWYQGLLDLKFQKNPLPDCLSRLPTSPVNCGH